LFEQEPTILRVGAYSVDPVRFAALLERHPGAAPMLGVTARPDGTGRTPDGARPPNPAPAGTPEDTAPDGATPDWDEYEQAWHELDDAALDGTGLDGTGLDGSAPGGTAPDGTAPDADGPHQQAVQWAVKQAVLRALGAPIRLRARWPEMEVSRDPDGRWRVTSRGPVRQFHEAHTLGHVDVTVSRDGGRITAFAVLTRDVTAPPERLPDPADLPDRVHVAGVNGPTDPGEY
jgi:hypothetical protein